MATFSVVTLLLNLSFLSIYIICARSVMAEREEDQCFTFLADEPIGNKELGDMITVEGECAPDLMLRTLVDISFYSPSWENKKKKLQIMLHFAESSNWPEMRRYDMSPKMMDGNDMIDQRGRRLRTFTEEKVLIQIMPFESDNESSMFFFGNRPPIIVPISYDHFRSLTKVTLGGDPTQPLSSFRFTSCPWPFARIIETSIVPQQPIPFEPVTLTCVGTGSPLLEAAWLSDTTESERGPHTISTITDTSHPAPIITTTLVFQAFNASHAGTWTCRIGNKNFLDTVLEIYQAQVQMDLHWSSSVTLLSKPDNCFVREDGDTLRWIVQGWPLDKVGIFDDHFGNDSTISSTVSTRDFPPRKTIIMIISNINEHEVALHNEVEVMDSCKIYRVGYSCLVGEYAIDDKCLVCRIGETSRGKGTPCLKIEQSCQRNQYWNGAKCVVCPDGTISNRPAAKVQDCQMVHLSYRFYIIIILYIIDWEFPG